MDDLTGLDWSSMSNNSTSELPRTTSGPYYPSLQPTPSPSLSGRSTPLDRQSAGPLSNGTRLPKSPPPKSSTPANDSFSGLLSLGLSKQATSLSLQERQKQLLEEKARQDAEQRKRYEKQFGANHGQFWDTLGSGKTTPGPGAALPPPTTRSQAGSQSLSRTVGAQPTSLVAGGAAKAQQPDDEDDLLAAFNSSAPVDASTHFPVPSQASWESQSSPRKSLDDGTVGRAASGSMAVGDFGDDDDPFGLGQMSGKTSAKPPPLPTQEDDDILGMLGKPVSEVPHPKAQTESPVGSDPHEESEQAHPVVDPRDKAVAELVDMGFPVDKSARALAQTGSGTDVQAAVSRLLNQAHDESKQKAERGRENGRQVSRQDDSDVRSGSRSARGEGTEGALPAWMREQDERSRSGPRKRDGQSPAGEKDVAQYASEISSTLFKSANSLWKQGQKKVQKAVAELQQEGDSSQPKWMRDTRLGQSTGVKTSDRTRDGRPARPADGDGGTVTDAAQRQSNMTDEAMLLESGDSRPQRPKTRAGLGQSNVQPDSQSRGQSPSLAGAPPERPLSRPKPPQPEPLPQRNTAGSRLTRQELEDQTAQAYISPARRKKKTPVPSEPEPDLLNSSQAPPRSTRSPLAPAPLQSNRPAPAAPALTQPSRPTPPPTRPKPPSRTIPPVSPTALSSSTTNRQSGTAAFKRGDYPAALTSYTSALTALPSTHPLTILLLTNRALTHLKLGDPKAALGDADAALAAIGPGRGAGETIALGAGEGARDMRDSFGKALARRAEALEALERWADAAAAWRQAVRAGVAAAVSIQARDRCEKAAAAGAAGTAVQGQRAQQQQQQQQQQAKPQQAAARPQPPAKRPAPAPAPSAPAASAKPAAAVQKLRAAHAAAAAEDDERFALADAVAARLAAWKGSRADNLRALLGGLDAVLWPGAGWRAVGMAELVPPGRVKAAYVRAIAKVHPDKIPQDATTEQRMIGAAVFSTLNEAWDKFKRENGL